MSMDKISNSKKTNVKEATYSNPYVNILKNKKNKNFHCNYAVVVAEINKPFLERFPFNNMTASPL